MKTTVEISDALLDRARRRAREVGKPMRALIEEGLRLVLAEESSRPAFRLEDRSIGDPDAPNPLETFSWQDLRDEIYERR